MRKKNYRGVGCIKREISKCEGAVLAGIAARYTPDEARLYIAERQHLLKPYAKLPHCDGYADDSDGFWRLLSEIGDIIKERIEFMRDRLKDYNEMHPDNRLSHIIVVDGFDALAGIAFGKEKKPLIQKLLYVLRNGIGLGIHLVASMSTPILPPFCKELQSYSSWICLAVRDWKESVSVVGYKGGDCLFEPGAGLLRIGGRLYKIKFGYAEAHEIKEIVE